MTPALLAAAGELLYGKRWQSDLARDIGRARTVIAEAMAGKRNVTPATWDAVMEALQIRQYEIAVFLDKHLESTSLVAKPNARPARRPRGKA